MSDLPLSVWIGFDPREAAAFAVCRASIRERLTIPVPIYGLVLDDLRARGLYTRATEIRVNEAGQKQMWDVISDAPCATEFSISRFLTVEMAKRTTPPEQSPGWALFMDSDILCRENLVRLVEELDPHYAVMCVKHRHAPPAGKKMDAQEQTRYRRKNWSSFTAYNCSHPANAALTVEMVNTVPGRELHAFCWLQDAQIGGLSTEWNWLIGHNRPRMLHYTEGLPNVPGYEDCDYAEDWRKELQKWAERG